MWMFVKPFTTRFDERTETAHWTDTRPTASDD